MAQTVFSKTAILDFYGQPGTVANPPANFARLYYNAGSNQLICVDSNGNNLITGGGGSVSTFTGDGTVLSNSGSTGAVTATLATHAANTVFAGPASGSAATPTFRSLTGNDISPAQLGAMGFGSGALLSGLTEVSVRASGLAAGDNDIYTVPANSRAILAVTAWNSNVTGNVFPEVKISGTYYRVAANLSVVGFVTTPASAVASSFGYNGIILEAGQSFSLNSAANVTLNVLGTAYVFPNTSSMKTAFNLALTTGDNTLYTCPVGKTAAVVLTNNQILGSTGAALLQVGNGTGGSLNYYYNMVASGGSPATGNRFAGTTAVGGGALNGFLVNGCLAAGDFISVNSSGAGAGQIAWATIQET